MDVEQSGLVQDRENGAIRIRPLGKPGDLGWVVQAHGELYAAEFGWDGSFEALVARIVADYAGHADPVARSSPVGQSVVEQSPVEQQSVGAGPSPSARAFWIAELDGRRVGCVCCVPEPAAAQSLPEQNREIIARLRILLVHPQARGHGLGGRLVDTCLDFARDAGYQRMLLWTYHPLAAARNIYLQRGFRIDHEEPQRIFGADLIGQSYELRLGSATSGRTHAH